MDMIKFVKSKADSVVCDLALHNYKVWFGNPYNQIEILERLNDSFLAMMYNFHHAHEYVDEFEIVANKIISYLSFVNLNGIKKEGPEIIPLGEGNHEVKMIISLVD